MWLIQTLFWLSLSMLVYTYIGYPVLISTWARLRPLGQCRMPIVPTVSILLVVRNGQAHIKSKIDNLLELDYPYDKLELVIASDGSDDDTIEIVRSYQDSRIRVLAYGQHRGKPAVLNQTMPILQGQITVLMDVRQIVDLQALRALVSNFADPIVGAVSGELILNPSSNGSEATVGVGFYWRYEKFIRAAESKVASCIGVTGAFYAIRTELFAPIPDDTLLDDVLIPMQIVRQGYRVMFEPRARVRDFSHRAANNLSVCR